MSIFRRKFSVRKLPLNILCWRYDGDIPRVSQPLVAQQYFLRRRTSSLSNASNKLPGRVYYGTLSYDLSIRLDR